MTEILITSSVLILALLVVRKLFSGSLSRRVQYALWALVLVRLLLPVQLPAMNFSVLNAAKPVEQAVTKSVAEQPIYVPVAQAPLEEQPKARRAKPENTLIKVGQSVWIAEEEQETAVKYRCVSPLTILSWVRMAGSCIVGAFLLFANLRFWLWLRKARKPYEAEDCKLRVYLVEAGLPSPCLFGLFRPAIYLTPAALESKTKLRHVLAHELTHARHLDHIWTLLRGVCLALYWFDPLVWVAATVSNADCELACDEGTLARLEEADRIPYGKTLLSLVPVRQTANPLLATTAMVAGKRQLKDRFTRIAKRSRQTVAAVVAVAVLVAAVSACTFTKGEDRVIHILTDLGHNADLATGFTNTSIDGQKAIDTAMEALQVELPAGFTVEVEVMPTDETEFQTRLTRLRTEIMSGKGPDIYVLSTWTLAGLYPQECLFPDTEKAMLDGRFLKLDDYMDKAQYMEIADMNPTIMEAGCTPEGRFALPMAYTFSALKTREPVTNTEAGWFDVIHRGDDLLADWYATAVEIQFCGVFPELIDYENKTLLFTEEELYDAVSTSLERLPPWGSDSIFSDTIENLWIRVEGWGIGNGWGGNFSPWHPDQQDGAVYVPMRNRDGGVSANVTSYVAINSGTPYPKEAFQLVDMIMSKEFQSGELGNNIRSELILPVFSWSLGISVYDDFLQKDRPSHYRQCLDDSMFPVWCELRDKITDARIMSSFDQILGDMIWNARKAGMTPGDELKKYVSEEYRKMLLMAGEL